MVNLPDPIEEEEDERSLVFWRNFSYKREPTVPSGLFKSTKRVDKITQKYNVESAIKQFEVMDLLRLHFNLVSVDFIYNIIMLVAKE